MTDTTASFYDATSFDGRGVPFGDVRRLTRGVLGNAAMGVVAVAAVGATIATATVAGVWMVGMALSGNPHLQARASAGPARLALADSAAFPQASFEARWAQASTAVPASVSPHVANHQVAELGSAVTSPQGLPHLKVKHETAHAPALTHAARLTPPAASAPARPRVAPPAPKHTVARHVSIPLPRRRPFQHKIALAPAEKPAPQLAMVTPPPAPPVEKRAAPREAHNKGPALPSPESRTALYDIAGHTVYLPNGARLEAHSGLGSKLDDPRYVKVRMRGPTPPNVYELSLRERLFHGVRAIRLKPIDDSKMFGRDGMLAHTYMLGPNGQSNGCVSFKNYQAFLRAYLNGEVDRLVVVARLRDAPPQLASRARAGREGGYRYAANDVSPASW